MFKFFGKHYGTERFFVIIFTCFAIMIGTVFYAGHLSNELKKAKLDGTVIYTTDTIWSKTKNALHVDSVYSNKDRTKVFMLLQNLEGENTSLLQSIDAKDYQMFVTTAENGPYTKKPKVTVFAYGNTGYFGIYLVDMSGFSNEVLSIILRSNTAASDMIEKDEIWEGTENDVSFIENNQVRLYMNFGADGMPTLSALDNETVDPVTVYNQIKFAEQYENTTRITWASRLETMNQYLQEIAQYRDELEKQGVIVPDLPYYIANDYINRTPNDFTIEPMMFTENMFDADSMGSDGTSYMDEFMNPVNGNQDSNKVVGDTYKTYTITTDGKTIEKPYLYLHTNYIYPGGLNFEWQDVSYVQGLVSKLPEYFNYGDDSAITKATNFMEWSEEMKLLYPVKGAKDSLMPLSVTYQVWRRVDGSYIDTTDPNVYEKASIDKYTIAVNNYMKAKYEYQVELFGAEIKAQGDARRLESIMTKNSENVLYTY